MLILKEIRSREQNCSRQRSKVGGNRNMFGSIRQVFRVLGQYIQVFPISVNPISLFSGYLFENSGFQKRVYCLVGCRLRAFGQFQGFRRRNHRVFGQFLEQPNRGNIYRTQVGEYTSIVADQSEHALRGGWHRRPPFPGAPEKKVRPPFPVAACPYPVQSPIVFLPVAFESEADVKEWTVQKVPVFRKQRNHQSTHTPVAVEKRVDGFKLDVGQPGFYKRRQLIIRMNPFVERSKQLPNGIRGRRNEFGIAWTRSADPVLGSSNSTRLLFLSSHTLHQPLVNFTNQAGAERKSFWTSQFRSREVQHINVVANLLDVGNVTGLSIQFKRDNILQRRLGPFDLGRDDYLYGRIRKETTPGWEPWRWQSSVG